MMTGFITTQALALAVLAAHHEQISFRLSRARSAAVAIAIVVVIVIAIASRPANQSLVRSGHLTR
jgi:hypothetical protein